MSIGSSSLFHKNVLKSVDKAVSLVLEQFLKECRLKTPDRHNVRVIIDAGWSHPGWWARECTVIAIDGQTGLLLHFITLLEMKIFQDLQKVFKLILLF